MHYYYSIYRKDYLYKGLVLYESMKIHDSDFKFFLVCMEEESVELLKKMNFIDLYPISIKEIEEYDKRILELKCQRGEKTYIWTAKASVPLYLFDKYQEMDHIIWLDGDTEFLSSPAPIYQEWGENSVLLTPERFTGEYEYLGHLVGFYNTGFMGFKNNEIGRSALNYFKERLQEWKSSEEEQGNWNDQLYVDDWTERFSGIGVSKHDGINLTPFIASRINNEENGLVNMKGGVPHIKDIPIVLYHFMALKYYDGNEFDLCNYWMKLDKQTIEHLYLPYFNSCSKAFERIRYVDPNFYPDLTIKDKYIGNYFNRDVNKSQVEYNICTITTSDLIPQTLSLYHSIKKYNHSFRLWICCKDPDSYTMLKRLNLPEVLIFEPSNFIGDYEKFVRSGCEVSKEVIKARLMNFILSNNYNIKSMVYTDCNCYFHQSPTCIFDMLKEHSIVLFESISDVEKGIDISNSIIGFNRDNIALDCLFYWVEKTKDWLKSGVSSVEEIEYMNNWKQAYSKVLIQRNPAYLLDDSKLTHVKIKLYNDKIYVNNELLILYQYSLDQISENSLNKVAEKVFQNTPSIKKYIYLHYLKSIRTSLELLAKAKQ